MTPPRSSDGSTPMQRESVAQMASHLEIDEAGTFARFGEVILRSDFQPIISLAHRRVMGFEALMRGYTADGRIIPPLQLLADAARAGTMEYLDRLSRFVHFANFTRQADDSAWLFLNVLPRVFYSGWRANIDSGELPAYFGLPARRIVLEILEVATDDESSLELALANFRASGLVIAIDDFGSGESNFDRVWRLAPDIVKLDRTLIQRAPASASVRRLIRHLVAMLHQAGALVVAEGIEREDEAMALIDADIDMAQGFALSRPGSSIAALIRQAEEKAANLWAKFLTYGERSARDWRNALKPAKYALLRASVEYQRSGDLSRAATEFWVLPGALRLFVVDRKGAQTSSSIANPARPDAPKLRVTSIAEDVGADWSRRAYFKQAQSDPGRVFIVGPHVSLMDGRDTFTAAVSIEVGDEEVVLCGNFSAPELM